jgi:YbbR domain-containing protein
MNRFVDDIVSWFWVAIGVTRAVGNDLGRHWVMASFSLVAGFGVWFAIQDVENPRVTQEITTFPGPAIPIEGRNVPEGYIFGGGTVTRLSVEARESDIDELTADDFEAWVDLSGVDPSQGLEPDVEIHVTSRRDGVERVEAIPSSMPVRLLEAKTREFPVRVNQSGALPDGYELEEAAVEPGFVTVTGTEAQLNSIANIDIDVSLDGRRDETSTFEGDLVARSSSGPEVTVAIDPPRAKVTLQIQQTFSQRTLPVQAPITGHPAPGYEIERIVIEPAGVVVSGPKANVDELTRVLADAVDIGGATTDVSQTRQLRIPNISVQPTTVLVRVEIRRDECEITADDAGCPTATFMVAVNLQAPPPGLRASESTPYWTQVYVSGPLSRLQELTPSDFVASASLAGGTAGAGTYGVAVVAPSGVTAEAQPISVTLVSAP